MKKFLVTMLLAGIVRSTLTADGVVTASSYDSNTSKYDPQFVVDGNMSNDQNASNSPGCFRTLQEQGEGWINVQLSHPSVVFMVILINREDSQIGNLAGSEIRVGNDPLPKNNMFCAYADTSGAYECSTGLQGTYVGIYNPNMNNNQLCLCEIRAYPWIGNQFTASITSLFTITGFAATNALDFVTDVINDSLAKNNKASDSRYVYNLSSAVHVYATILIGDPSSDFRNTKDWYITAGTNVISLTNQAYTAYQGNEDRFGLEAKIDTLASKVAFIRTTNNEQFNIIYAAVFATSIDCATISLDWSELIGSSPYRYPLRKTPAASSIAIDPKSQAECVLAFEVKLQNGAAIPSFMQFNNLSRNLSIMPTKTSDIGIYDINVIATYWNGVSPLISSNKIFRVEIFAATQLYLNAASVIPDQTYKIGDPLILLNRPSYSFLPANADIDLSYSLSGQPSFVKFVGNQISIYSAELAGYGPFVITITVTDSLSGLTASTQFKLKIACYQTFTPTGVQSDLFYMINSSPIVSRLPQYDVSSSCTPQLVYKLTLADGSPLPAGLSFDPDLATFAITIYSQDTTLSATYDLVLRVEDSNTLNFANSITLKVKIYCFSQIKPGSVIPDITYRIDAANPKTFQLNSPQFVGLPKECQASLMYTLTLEPQGTQPTPFLTFDQVSGLIITTGDVNYTGSYSFKLIATDQTSQVQNVDNTFQVSLVCSPNKIFLLANGIIDQVYFIGSPPLVVTVPTYQTLPTQCQLNTAFSLVLEDVNSGPLPPFIAPATPTNFITIETADNALTSQPFTMKLRASIDADQTISTEFEFSVIIKKCPVQSVDLITGGNIGTIKYRIMSSAVTFQAPTYSASPSICTVDIQVQLLRTDNPSASLQEFITYSSATGVVHIETTNSSLAGSYLFFFKATDLISGVFNSSLAFQVDLQANELILEANPVSDVTYKIEAISQVITIPLPKYNALGQINLTFELVLISFAPAKLRALQAVWFPPFISQHPTSDITIQTSDVTLAGVYLFKIIAKDTFSNLVNDTVRFQVTLTCQSTGIKATYDSKTLTQVSFTIKQDTISFPVPRYETTPKGCMAQPIPLSLQNLNSANLPSFISLNNGVIRLSGGSLQEGRKTFQFVVVASSDNLENRDFKFEVTTLINNQAPYFLSEIQDMKLKINTDQKYPTWSLPKIKDKENDLIVQTLIGLGDAKDWLTFDYLTGVFKVKPELIKAGEFTITIQITDSSNSVADFAFKIFVEPADPITDETDTDKPELEIPNQKSFAELYNFVTPASSYIAQNGQQSIIITPLLASLSKPDLNGGFKVKFSELVFMLVVDAIKSEHIMSIEILWKNPEYQSPDSVKPQYSWSVRNMTNEFLQFQLEFAEPLQISQGKQPDVLVVRFEKRTYFRRRTDNEALNESCILLMQPIPMQAPNQKEAIRITETLQQFKGISGTTVFILLFYALMNLPKSLFWSLHGTIQFVVYEPMHGGKYPTNVVYLYLLLNKLSNMTFDKAGEYLRKIFNPKLPEGTNNALVSAGIFIGVILLFVTGIIGFTLLRKLLVKCKNGRYIDKLIITEIRRTLMFSSILRFAQLGYMYIVVTSTSAVLGGQQQIFFKSKGETINSLIFYALFTFAIIYPICVTLFLMIMGPQRLAREAIIEKFRSLYLSLRLNSRINLLVTVNFLVRRAIVGTSIAVLGDRYEFQLIILLLACLYCAVSDFAIMPFSEKQLNFVQMMNEIFLLLSVYMMHLFSDFVPDDATRYEFGWYFVYLVFIIFGANMLIIGGHMLIDLCKMWRRYWMKKSIKQKINRTLSEQRKRRKERQGSIKRKIVKRKRNGLLESIKEVPEDDDIFSSFESALEPHGVQLLSNASTLAATTRKRVDMSDELSEVRPYINISELQENTQLNTERPLLLKSDRQPRFDTPRRLLQSDLSSKKQNRSGSKSGRSGNRDRSLLSRQISQEDQQDFTPSDSESRHSAIHVIEEESEERYKLNSNSPSRLQSRAQSRLRSSAVGRLSFDMLAEDSPIIPQIQSAEQSCISISELEKDTLSNRKSNSLILNENNEERINIEILDHDRRRMTREQTTRQTPEKSSEDPYGGESNRKVPLIKMNTNLSLEKSSKISSISTSRRETLKKLKSHIQSMHEAIDKYTSMCQTPEQLPESNAQSPGSLSSTNAMMLVLQDNLEKSANRQKTSRLFITNTKNLEQPEKFNYPTTCVSPTALGPAISRNPLSRAAASTFEEPLSQSGLIQFDSAFAPKAYAGKQSALPVSANIVSVNYNDKASNDTPWILSTHSDFESKAEAEQKYAAHFSSIRVSNDHTNSNPYDLKSPQNAFSKGFQEAKKSMDMGSQRPSLLSLQQSLKQISNQSLQGRNDNPKRRTLLANSGSQIISMTKSTTEEKRQN